MSHEELSEEPSVSCSSSLPDDNSSAPLDGLDQDKVQRAADDLLADAERGDGQLARADVDRLYFKRRLTPAECAAVERMLREARIRVIEPEPSAVELADSTVERTFHRASDTLTRFIRQVHRAPFLNEIQERECGRAIQLYLRALAAGNSSNLASRREFQALERRAYEAKRRLIETNLRWVARVATRYYRQGQLDLADLVQEGTIGLIKATEKFDPDLGFRFKTYATWWITQSITRAIADKSRTIRLPVHVQERLKKLLRVRKRLIRETGREPSYDDLGKALGISAKQVAKTLWYADCSELLSLDEPTGEDQNIAGLIEDKSVLSPDLVVERRELHHAVRRALATLTPQEEHVIRRRFGLDQLSDATLQKISEEFGVTRERIRQIEVKALKKLRHPTRSRKLRGFALA